MHWLIPREIKYVIKICIKDVLHLFKKRLSIRLTIYIWKSLAEILHYIPKSHSVSQVNTADFIKVWRRKSKIPIHPSINLYSYNSK